MPTALSATALTALTLGTMAHGLNTEQVLTALKAAGNPEALATDLLQGNNIMVEEVDEDTSCATKTGYEHCTDCAMPAIKTLVVELVKVKDTVWEAQKDMASNAKTVCDQDAPANRAGGAAKCCSADFMTSAYEAAGFNGCTAGSTFSPKDPNIANSKGLKYNQLTGFHYDPDTANDLSLYTPAPSSMVTDCCRTESTCATNDVAIKDSMDTTLRLMSTLMADKMAKTQKIDSVSIEVQLETTKLADYRAEILKICSMAEDASNFETDIDSYQTDEYATSAMAGEMHWPASLEMAVPGTAAGECGHADQSSSLRAGQTALTCGCTGGQVFAIVEEEKVRQLKLDKDTNSFARTIEVIKRVIAWLDHDGTNIFKDNLHTGAPTVGAGVTTYAPGTTVAPSHDGQSSTTGLDSHWSGSTAMVSLLESAAKSSTNTQAKQALSKAAQLLEGGTSAVRGAAKVIELLEQILGDMESSKAKIETYKTTSQVEANDQITNLVAQITNLKNERETGLLHKARLTDSMAGYTMDVNTKQGELDAEKTQWALKYDQRELNSDKCIKFMNFFDEETQTNTGEILILKKTIDIIKHITCEATSQPTAFPTAFPTTSPTVLTNSPTAYPTRAPTAVPTGAPTAAPTEGNNCESGTYKFMSKVFANPERFAVPAYADGVDYLIETMTAGQCQTIETSHTNVEGAVQTIKHQYKCCGDTGSLYGAISQSDKSAAMDLCADSGNEDHCGLFGANMYTGDADPTDAGITTGQTTAPTAAPTSFPTRAPSDAPTAYPTKAPSTAPTAYPTEAPTKYPTALAHADDALQVASAYNTAVYNITEEANSTEVSEMRLYTAAPASGDGAAARDDDDGMVEPGVCPDISTDALIQEFCRYDTVCCNKVGWVGRCNAVMADVLDSGLCGSED
jgi:hypothetical protein